MPFGLLIGAVLIACSLFCFARAVQPMPGMRAGRLAVVSVVCAILLLPGLIYVLAAYTDVPAP